MREKTFKRRVIAIILVIASLFTTLPISVFAGDGAILHDTEDTSETSKKVEVLHNGAAKNSVTVSEDGREILTASAKDVTVSRRTWQILDPDHSEWIDIYGKTDESIAVTYALVGSMLNDAEKAYIRVRVGDGESYYVSEPVEITISRKTELQSREVDLSGVAYKSARPSIKTASAADDEEYKTYSIVINYIFDNGGLAFEPYGATVAAGSDFHATIASPKVVGYEPFRRIGEAYVDASSITLDYTNINENITINVIYEPAIVDFQVHHHFQNLLDDDYSLHYDRITYGKGLTGSTVPENLAFTEAELPGFKALAYEKLTIAADGSTVVEIRYDRNYHLISFELSGGFGTEPIYTRFGSSVGANNPTRPGYLFDGWELISYGGEVPSDAQKAQYDINSALITVPNANLVYQARWITQVTNYTMVFWKENINDTNFTFWGYKELQAMSGSYVSGSDRVREAVEDEDVGYFKYCDALTDKNVMVEGDGSTIVNVYYTRNRYSLTFKAPGLCVIPENHTHTEACYIAFCKGGHVHTDECVPKLSCQTPEHSAHTDSCIICGQDEHVHSNCCGLAEHSHTTACYSNVGYSSNPNGAPSNAVDGQIYKRGITYYVRIAGKWYRYSGKNVSSGDIIDPTCGKTNHTHTDSCCTIPEHTHSDACYRDFLHKHSESCYTYSCGLQAHEHSDACYVLNCGIPTGHTHGYNCTRASSTNVVKIVYKKYQQNLGKDPDNPDSDNGIWPIVDDNNVTYDDGQRWSPSGSNTYTQVLVYLANMPGESFTLTVNTSTYNPYTMNYYLEVLPDYEGETVTYNGKRFAHYTTILARYNYLTEAEDFFDIKGYDHFGSNPKFSGGQISISGTNRNVNLYYSRQTDHSLTFKSNGVVIQEKSVYGIQYGERLSSYNFDPDYPEALEPNAYYFDGWYTTPGHFAGTEVDWDNIRMEAGGIMLYAKWSPIVHKVTVYKDSSLEEQVGEEQTVAHGNFALPPDATVENGNYIFQGWFYMDVDAEGKPVEKAFVFNGIPVLDDLKIYAKWSSHVTVNYKINYVLKTTGEQIAESTEGSGIAGHNKTFYAKAGSELYAAFRQGYYPLTSSHTVTMSAESDHEFTFEYVYVESMPYAVRYLDENGEKIREDKKVMDNNLSVVTETFVKAEGMMPDAYQKRLILSANGTDSDGDGILDNNVIVFRYKNDTQHAYYRVIHYVENISGDGYREYRSEENVGIIGESYKIPAITITGFSFAGGKTAVNGVVTPSVNSEVFATLGADGLLIELYYDRQNVSYTVNYLEIGTNKVLYTQKTANGLFGAQAIEYAPGLTHLGYELVSDGIKQLNLSTDLALNVINFYYQEAVYSIKYQIVGPEGAGQLSMTSENVMAVTGNPGGSYPIVSSGYSFHGWYFDEACSHPVNSSWVDPETNRITPVRDGIWSQNHTYYAKIDPDFTTLTISTLGAFDIDESQVFIFRIKGTSEATLGTELTVMVIGNSSVTVANLRVGDYEVTELVDWSPRYLPDSEAKDISLSANASKNNLLFSHIREESKWMDGNNISTTTGTLPD